PQDARDAVARQIDEDEATIFLHGRLGNVQEQRGLALAGFPHDETMQAQPLLGEGKRDLEIAMLGVADDRLALREARYVGRDWQRAGGAAGNQRRMREIVRLKQV